MADEKQITVTKTIEYVPPTFRDWTNNDGKKMYFPECAFSDGTQGSVAVFSEDKAHEVLAAFQAVKDQAVEFTLKADPKVYNNVETYTVRDFPGMPKLGGGGGGGGGRGGGGMSHAQAGLLAAASALGPSFAWQQEQGNPFPIAAVADDVTQLADIFTDWLFNRRKGETTTSDSGELAGGVAVTGAAVPPPTPPAEVLTLPQRIALVTAKGSAEAAEEAVRKALGKGMNELSQAEAEALIGAWS